MSLYLIGRHEYTDLERKDEINHLLEFLESTMKQFNGYGKKDIRHDYFEFMHNLIMDYNHNTKNFFLRLFTECAENRTPEDLNTLTEEDIKREFEPKTFRHMSITRNLQRSLIVEAWSMFEFSVTIIFENHCKEEKDSSRKEKYSKSFKKILKRYFPENADNIDIAVEKMTDELDPFVPTMIKLNKIFKKYGKKYEEKDEEKYEAKEEDFDFLEFFGRLRNGIHHNFIYKGKNKKDFIFKGNVFKFQDGEFIIREALSDFLVIELLKRLFLAIGRYFIWLDINGKILNPTPTMDDLEKGKM